MHVVQGATHNEGYSFSDDLLEPIKDLLALEEIEELQSSMEVFVSAPHLPLSQSSGDARDENAFQPVVIVGAGPVGLFLAVSLVHAGVSSRDVVLLEKHETYQRHHVVKWSCLWLSHLFF